MPEAGRGAPRVRVSLLDVDGPIAARELIEHAAAQVGLKRGSSHARPILRRKGGLGGLGKDDCNKNDEGRIGVDTGTASTGRWRNAPSSCQPR